MFLFCFKNTTCIFVTFPCGILGQVWYLIVSFPDLCLLSYFEHLLISSSPAKAMRMLVGSRGLPSDSICFFKAEPGKHYIKRHEPSILFISLQVCPPFKLEIMTCLLLYESSEANDKCS